jgi:hypothetical protein
MEDAVVDERWYASFFDEEYLRIYEPGLTAERTA